MTALDGVLADATDRLRALDLGDAFEPRAAEAIVAAGLHRLVVPAAAGGLGARMSGAAGVLAALGAIDGSTALGFAMQVHVTGALVDSTGVAEPLRETIFRASVDDGTLLNNASTEFYVLAYIAMFTIGLFGSYHLRKHLPGWVIAWCTLGALTCVLIFVLNAYPFVDVASPLGFAVKILGTTVAANLVGYIFYRRAAKRIPAASNLRA